MPRVSLGILPIRCDYHNLHCSTTRFSSCVSILPQGLLLYIGGDRKTNPRRAYSSWREGAGQRKMGPKSRQGDSTSYSPPKPSSRYVYGFISVPLKGTRDAIHSDRETHACADGAKPVSSLYPLKTKFFCLAG